MSDTDIGGAASIERSPRLYNDDLVAVAAVVYFLISARDFRQPALESGHVKEETQA